MHSKTTSPLQQELLRRHLPPLRPRDEMKEILQREVYGYLPQDHFAFVAGDEQIIDARLARGKVHISSLPFTLRNEHGSHTFPLYRLWHRDGKRRPLIVYLNFHPATASFYFPLEELSESEYNILTFCYKDVTSDDGDFTTGIAPLIFPDGRTSDTDCGKIGLWALAAMRVLDYALTLPEVDADNVAVLGHSRLGKTALYTGMMDPRFTFAFSNNAGCAGDALARGGSGLPQADGSYITEEGKRGETIADITRAFPYWFCRNYTRHAAQNWGDNFDQHYLLATIAPRFVCVNAAALDTWADPHSQQLCCMAAAPQWGPDGMEPCDHYLAPGEALLQGNVGFFVTPTMHFMSRHAWQRFMEFMRLHHGQE